MAFCWELTGPQGFFLEEGLCAMRFYLEFLYLLL